MGKTFFLGLALLQVEIDPRRFNRWLNAQAQKQVPFAAARALTITAQRVQSDLREGIQRDMTVRRPWVLKGVQVKAAQKRDGLARMQAEVGSKDWFMADQLADAASGRKAKSGGKQFLPKAARRSKSALISAGLRPGRVTAAAKASDGGDGKFFFRQGRGGRSLVYQNLRGNRLKLLYTVGPVQTIRPKIQLSGVARMVAARYGEREFIRQMQAAIRSAR